MKYIPLTILVLILSISCSAQPHLVGYWQNWNTVQTPYIQIDQVDNRYSVVNVSFAVPRAGTKYDMVFTPCCGETVASLRAKIAALQSQGVIVNISIGGATAPIELLNIAERDIFISSMNNILTDYGFDGIDIDLEGSSFTVTGGTITNPTDVKAINMIAAMEQLLIDYQTTNGRKMFLSTAPETAFVQGGQSAWNGVWGAYLPLIDALREDWDLVHVQLYNSGSMYGIDGGIYVQGTADFIVSQTEAVIQGFNVDRWSNQAGPFLGLPPEIVAVGLPACPSAAGGGFTDPGTVKEALDYLLGQGPQPGSYTLQAGPYPTLGGMMTWSINWDKTTTCNNSSHEFAANYEAIFGSQLPLDLLAFTGQVRGKQHSLQWRTSEEIDFDRYVVEYAHNEQDIWQELGAVAGTGTGHEAMEYHYVVDAPTGSAYYRLRMIDDDGTFNYSNVIYLESRPDATITLYPNPSSGSFWVRLPETKTSATVMVSTLNGQIVHKETIAENMDEIMLTSDLPAGLYLVSVKTATQQWQQKMVVR